MNDMTSGTGVKKMVNGNGCDFPSPYEMSKVNGTCVHTEPMYATVKRTPRAPRTGSAGGGNSGGTDGHVYQYPLTLVGANGDHCFDTDSCLSLTSSAPANSFLRVHDDPGEKNLTGELLYDPTVTHSLSPLPPGHSSPAPHLRGWTTDLCGNDPQLPSQ